MSALTELYSILAKGKGLPEKGTEVLHNAPVRDIRRMAEEAPDNQLRIMKVGDDQYVWPAYDAEHQTMMRALGIPEGTETGKHFDNELLTYDKGKFHPDYAEPRLQEEADMYGIPYEDVRKEYMMRNYGLSALAGAAGLGAAAFPDQAHASYGEPNSSLAERLNAIAHSDIANSATEQANAGVKDLADSLHYPAYQGDSRAMAALHGAYAPFSPIVNSASLIGIPEMAMLEALAKNTYEKPLAYPTESDMRGRD